jgi:hypothetical protein
VAGAAARGDRFDDVSAALEDAAESVPAAWDAGLLLAGKRVRVHVAGQTLARLVRRPVAHLILGPAERRAEPDLSIHLSEAPDAPVLRVLRELRSDLPKVWSAPHLEVRSSACGRMVSFDCGPGLAFLLDRKNRVVVGEQDPARLVLSDRLKPLLLPLRVCLSDMGVHLVHSGLVAESEAGVLIGGPGGAGKSSAALGCFMAGFEFLGDDQSALTVSGREFVGHSLYNAVQVGPGWLPSFGTFPVDAIDHGSTDEKSGLFLLEVAPERLRRSVPIRVVILPRRTPGRPSATYPARRAEALMRIAPSTVLQPLGGVGEDVHMLSRLLLHTPAYWVDLGDDRSRIPDLIRQLLPRA